MAKTESVTAQLNDLLDQFSEDVQKAVDDSGKSTAKDCASKLRNSSPKRTGKYAKSWTSKKQDGGYIVYNSKHYQLTHLLENGHVVRNKYGTYGRAPAKKHIEPVEKWAIDEFQVRISRGLS